MTREEITTAVLDIVRSIQEDETELGAIDPKVPLREQLALDSMDFLDIVMELRKRYGVQVPEQDYKELATLDGCANYLYPKLSGKALRAGV